MKARIFFAVLLSGILFTPSAAAEDPALFVKLLYANYTHMDHWAKGYEPCHEYCEADFAKLLDAAHRKNMIDYDPICQCKGVGAKYLMFSGAQGATPMDYQATMMKFGDMHTSWVLVLKWINGDWAVHDIMEKRNGKPISIRQRLAGALS
jgi:hypothetical protein